MRVFNLFWPKKEAPKQPEKPKEATIWDEALATHEKLSKGWHQSAKAAGLPQIDTQLLFKAAGGSCYYAYLDPLRMPVERHKSLEQSLINLKLGLNEDYLDKQFLPLLERTSKLNDTTKMREQLSQLIEDFKQRRALPPSERTLLRLAAHFLLRHDEDPYTVNEVAIATKMQEVAEDSQLRGFFLTFALETALALAPSDYIGAWNIKSSSDFLSYLATKSMEQADKASGNR